MKILMILRHAMAYYNEIKECKDRIFTLRLLHDDYRDRCTWEYNMMYGPKVYDESIIHIYGQFKHRTFLWLVPYELLDNRFRQ